MTGRLADRIVLVTGGAKGIGAASVRRMAQEGARLEVCDLDAEALTALTDALGATGVDVVGTVGDVSDPAFVARWVADIIDRRGRIDVLYNNVGVSRGGLVADITDADWRFQQRLTLDTVFYCTRAVLPHMVQQGRGSIISMSSGAGIGGQYNLGGYAAAKAGVINLMETVALEYGPAGVRANSLTPGPTATEPFLAYHAAHPGTETALTQGLDLQRLSTPEEVANTVLWLASDESSNITGICIRSNIRSASARPF